MKTGDTIFIGQYLFTGSETTSVWLEVKHSDPSSNDLTKRFDLRNSHGKIIAWRNKMVLGFWASFCYWPYNHIMDQGHHLVKVRNHNGFVTSHIDVIYVDFNNAGN